MSNGDYICARQLFALHSVRTVYSDAFSLVHNYVIRHMTRLVYVIYIGLYTTTFGTDSLTDSFTHQLAHARTHARMHACTHARTRARMQARTHSFLVVLSLNMPPDLRCGIANLYTGTHNETQRHARLIAHGLCFEIQTLVPR